MRRSFFLVLCLPIFSFAAQPESAPVDTSKLITQDADAMRAILAKTTIDKKAQGKARSAAVMIAQYSQSAMKKDDPKNAALATLRDRALGVVKAIDDGKIDEATKLANDLSPDIKADPAVKTAPVALEKHTDIKALMKMFAATRQGGFGLESYLDELTENKGTADPTKIPAIAMYGQKMALIGLLTEKLPPARDDGDKTRKTWIECSKEMQRSAQELAAAARTLQQATSGTAEKKLGTEAKKLTDSCTRCHDVFR